MIKYIVFNGMYIPMVLVFQDLLFAKELSGGFLVAVLAAGQAGVAYLTIGPTNMYRCTYGVNSEDVC